MTSPPYVFENLFGRILSPFERFLRRTTAGGIILMAVTAATLILANTRWGWIVQGLQHQSVSFQIGEWRLHLDLHHWVNDGLMTFFFLLVGLELKREILVGELSSLRDAILPVIAAVGGMVVPAMIYLLLSGEGTAVRGWGIPMATDIAFSIGILVLLSWRIPKNLIVFLTALAIADDL
ncbi:MAG: Na+/H+ antiporter NhaA, partial [Syntrophobacteraceae bacterium]